MTTELARHDTQRADLMIEVNEKIAVLKATRLAIATRGRELALRELEAREVRAKLELELRKALTKTDAAQAAKLDPRYLEHERMTAGLAYERDVLFAEAEAQRLQIQVAILEATAAQEAI